MIKFKEILPNVNMVRRNVLEEYRPAPGVYTHSGNCYDISICICRASETDVEVTYTKNNSVISGSHLTYDIEDDIPAQIAYDLCVETEYHYDDEE
jgi:hypothetical protein